MQILKLENCVEFKNKIYLPNLRVHTRIEIRGFNVQ